MALLSWLLFGLIAGMLAKFLMPGNDPRGCIVTIVLGLAGAAVGGWIGVQLGIGGVYDFDIRSLGLAVLGSMVLLLGYRAVQGNRVA
jgi:uncharacterized membrane protein YeaQ/YmgE (transglycosylase-associated protein family)